MTRFLLVFAFFWSAVNGASAQSHFEVKTLETGAAISQSVLAVAGRLYVFSVTETGRHYRVYDRSDDYGNTSAIERVPATAIFVDRIRTRQGVLPVYIERGRVRRIDTGEALLVMDSLYNAPVIEDLPHLKAFRDLNDDGLDDLLVPSFDGFSLAIQQEDGTFSPTQTLPAIPVMDMSYNNHPWYQSKNLFHADMSADGRRDLVFWEENQFKVFVQAGDGSFSADPLLIASEVPLDFDSVDGMSIRLSSEDQSDKTVSVVHNIADFDGDSLPDLLVMQVKSEGVFRKTTTFSLHRGVRKPGDMVKFASRPSTSVESSGVQYEMRARDIDADGDLDLVVSSVELGVGKIIAALLTSAIKIELGLYPMTEGQYASKPEATRDITATFSLSSGEYWLPLVLVQDVDGDNRMDLLLQGGANELALYRGVSEEALFRSSPEPVEVPLPKDPDLVEAVHLNEDGVLDLVLRIPPPLGQASSHRVVLMISSIPRSTLD